MEVILVVLPSIAVCIWLYCIAQSKYRKCPPGPFRFPLIGCLPQFWLTSSQFPLTKLSQIWGEILFLKLGTFKTVVISSHDASLILRDEKTEKKLVYGVLRERLMGKNLGVNFSNGVVWKTLRRFTIQTLKDSGMGKYSLDTLISEEVEKLISDWKNRGIEENSQILFESMFNTSILCMFIRVLNGQNVALDNTKMKHLSQSITDFHHLTNGGIDISLTFPFLWNCFPAKWTCKQRQEKCCRALHESCREIFNQTEEKEFNAKKNFSTNFYKKVPVDDNVDDCDYCFTEDQLIVTLLDIMQNGVDTISAALSFSILYSILWPETQERIQSEIDSIIKQDPSFNDELSWNMRHRLPYTMAFIFEVLRFSSILPTVFPHEATNDFFFKDFLIAKGTSIILNIHCLNTSKSVWGDPENFRPQRFLSKDGVLDVNQTKLVLAFGIGRRICSGQLLAEQAIFIYLTTLFKTYKFVPSKDSPPPVVMSEVELSVVPRPFYASVVNHQRLN